MIRIKKEKTERLRQGEIISNVEYIESIEEEDGNLTISKIVFPYVVILTQDCDLSQDSSLRTIENPSNTDKKMLSVLVAPLYNLEHFYIGEHLNKLDMKMLEINRKKSPGQNIVSNQNPRYHTLEFPNEIEIVDSVIDFKHYFSINIEYLYKIRDDNFICEIDVLFRELLTQRFASYLSRIGLPV